MPTSFEERRLKDKCKELHIDAYSCGVLIRDIPTSMNAEAEFWLGQKDKAVTEKRTEILVKLADDSMEGAADNIEEIEESW